MTAGREGTQSEWDHRRLESGAAGLGCVFQADRNQTGTGRTRRLAQAQTALHPVAAVEAPGHARQESDEGGTDAGAGIPLGLQSTRAMVEQWRQPHERGLPEVLL